jgi:hypothetical protein
VIVAVTVTIPTRTTAMATTSAHEESLRLTATIATTTADIATSATRRRTGIDASVIGAGCPLFGGCVVIGFLSLSASEALVESPGPPWVQGLMRRP